MRPPVEGAAGKIWRTVTGPARLLAPGVSIAGRAAKSEFWVQTESESPGPAPSVDMSDRPGLQRPGDGVGPLIHRRYRVHIAQATLTPAELMTELRQDPNAFSPTSFATFDPPPQSPGMRVGDEFAVRLPGPWDGPVVVAEAGEQCVRLETRDGHMEAGWIRFTTLDDDDQVVFEIESLARSGDPAFDLLYHPGRVAKLVQTEMWIRVLEAAVEISGGRLSGRPTVHTTIYQAPDRDRPV